MTPRTFVFAVVALLVLGSSVRAAQQGQGGTPSSLPAGPPAGSAQVAALLPDLFVVSIDFTHYQVSTKPDGTKQGSAYAGFTVKNGGKTRTKPFTMTWEFWNHAANAWQPFLGQFFTDQVLEAGQSRTIGGQPVDNIIWTIGVNTPRFRVRLDTTGAVAETNEANNELIKEFKPIVAGPAAVPKLK
jgi:hypothetical protein